MIDTNVGEPEFAKMLTLSTFHIKQESTKWLDEQAAVSLDSHRPDSENLFGGIRSVAAHGCGWDLSVPGVEGLLPQEEDPQWEEIPEEIAAALTFAAGHGCAVLRYDQDGGLCKYLRTFDW